jgi:transposase
MAYITHKKIKGRNYYYAEESEWRDGRPRRKWQKYLGSLTKIMEAMQGKGEKPQYAEIFQLGAPAAYWRVAEECGMVSILDDILPKRQQGLSIGFYLTLAAMNRAIQPVSKRSMWHWFQETILLRMLPEVNQEALNSQRFWDNLSTLKASEVDKAWLKLVHSVLAREHIDLSCVSFDGTNFYSFIGSFNRRCSLAKRGKNKQGRTNLRQVNYALFCTRKDHIPLFFDVFEGNRHDSKEFGLVIEKFFRAFADYRPAREGITVVFDKGNNSPSNLNAFVNKTGYHFVGSVKLNDHKDLARISNQDACFAPLADPRLEQVKAFRRRKLMYGKERTVVVTFNNNLYTAQVQSVNNELNKCLGELSDLSKKLDDRRVGMRTKGKAPTIASVRNQMSTILKGQYMKRLIETSVIEQDGLPLLSYSINAKAQAELNDTYLGKTILFTDNNDWSTEDIILAYRSQYIIEDTFKQMKDRKTGTWWPMFHWTDPMIRAHAFYCSLALLLRALLMRKVRKANLMMSMNKLHEKLSGIREIINIFKKTKKKGSTQSVLSKQDEVQKRLFDLFDMKRFLSS